MNLRAILGRQSQARLAHWRGRVAIIGLLVLALIPGGLYLQVRRHSDDQPRRPADAIIVAGSGGSATRPSPVYRARLDHALSLYQRGFAPRIIVTERTPGAEGARRYLLQKGVPEHDLLMENRSTTTWENLRFAHEIMRANGWESAIVTSCGFHLYRATRMARALDIEAQAAAAPASPIEADPLARERMSALEVRKMFAHALYEPPWPAADWWERVLGEW